MITIFTLVSGRSGTRFLCDLIKQNATDCVCRHEPYFNWFNPNMFGKPIDYHTQGNFEAIRKLLRRKKRGIEYHKAHAYIETSHAFLKSFYTLALDFFPDMKLVHLVRHPLSVAKSETNRETKLDQVRFPMRRYKGMDGGKYFRWSLTGNEPIYRGFDLSSLSLFQRYVIQWIEIENRAISFLDDNDMRSQCFTLDSPRDLNDAERVKEMFRFLTLATKSEHIEIAGSHNQTPGARTVITDEDREQFAEVVAALPESYLDIFQREPYSAFEWSALLRK